MSNYPICEVTLVVKTKQQSFEIKWGYDCDIKDDWRNTR